MGDKSMKILLLDIETAPNLAYVWGLWEQNVGLSQLVKTDYILCWSAKWLGEDKMHYASRQDDSAKQMLKPLHKLIDEADAVVHYNGKKFDMPWINREFLVYGMPPPSPYKQIDLLDTVRAKFRFPSRKLDYVSKALGLGEKAATGGFELWLGCIKNDKKSWATMQKYNIQDVILLEKLYMKLRPWIKGHANHSMFNPTEKVCPHCGGKHHQKRGFAFTLASKYQRYQCMDCKTWFKDNVILNRTEYKTSEIV
jgi:DNA-directed RNA polymerase subunit RPC12/RpoP